MSHTAARTATRERDTGRYQRHWPEQTLFYQIVEAYCPVLTAHLAERGRELPGYVQREFEDYLKYGRLEHGFLRVRCESCYVEHLVAFSCKRRGFCPSCGPRRMAESVAQLVDEVLPEQPMRQWVLSFPLFRYQLKTPYRDGTTHVIFEPMDFIARLAALVPKPRVNLTRFHGVFAPNSKHRVLVTPAKRGKGNKANVSDEPPSPVERRTSMTWAQRLKRVFNMTSRPAGNAVVP
jgi:ribosomal protein S27E